jgi:hypothetical protein
MLLRVFSLLPILAGAVLAQQGNTYRGGVVTPPLPKPRFETEDRWLRDAPVLRLHELSRSVSDAHGEPGRRAEEITRRHCGSGQARLRDH